jgi:glycosyltransferase involved in cell wall biosynthesis
VLARFKPDVVVVQEIHPQVMVQRLKAAGIPHAVYIHEVEEIDHLRPVGEDGVPFIANSRFTAQRLRERCGIEAHVIRPIIDPAQYVTPTSREHVLFVNTIPRKGVEVALDLARARPDIPFDMVQGWTLKPPQVAVLRGRLPANVTLHPATRDMRPRYAQARLLLAPSQWEEAWGRVATEAQVSGIPVLASSRGGLPEAVGDGGLLLPADAPGEEWARALGRLWDDAAAYARYAAAAAEHGRRPEIQPETIVEDLLSLLRGLKGSAR